MPFTLKIILRAMAAIALAAVALPATLLLTSSVAYSADAACTPSHVMVYSNRVHIRCEETFGGIQFFAAPTTDAAYVSRVLSIISTATVAGRTVIVFYDPDDTSGTAIGCASNDCRLIGAVGFWR